MKKLIERFQGFNCFQLRHWGWLFATFNDKSDFFTQSWQALGWKELPMWARFHFVKYFSAHGKTFQLISVHRTTVTGAENGLYVLTKVFKSLKQIQDPADPNGRVYEYVYTYTFGDNDCFDGLFKCAEITPLMTIRSYSDEIRRQSRELKALIIQSGAIHKAKLKAMLATTPTPPQSEKSDT